MLSLIAATATSTMTRPTMPASSVGVSAEPGHLAAVGTTAFAAAIHTPAFVKDVVSGVRAWSPPF